MCILFCFIPKEKKLSALKKRIFLGALGFICLMIAPCFSLKILTYFNLFQILSFSGIFFIIFGSLPYKNFALLEKNPHKIIIKEDFLILYFFNSPLIKIKINGIIDMEYISKKNFFGIKLLIEKNKITLLEQRTKIIHKFLKKYSYKKKNKEIFILFPYFNENSYKQLKLIFKPTPF